ncbi:MAG: penicillin-binding protein 2 [Flavobacterium sp.]|uniref:penicillin-binding protein 2 n=1 Tax=unclassified Flavobacterium TaxID=196869 RepID=UPI000C476895|nr:MULTISPECIES: penicillin-binding protein 2 [unclassified Flavobacterium]MBF02090.1 penicillin-binding protein 2 [Flavobacterium sp.]MCO6161371.1 penicillin-binding protein 2 [Flavobacterium sp. NRK F7]
MRKIVLPSIIIIAAIVLIVRIFYLQIVDDSLKLQSENNAIKKVFDFPERGYIYDRNGKLMVANQPSYDIMVIPREIKNLDTLDFCNLLKIDKKELIEKIRKATVYSPRLPSVFLAQLNKKEYAAFQEKERKFEGFYTQKRALRDYQVDFGANIFGFITQVNEAIIKKNPYYNSGDLIGKQGVEQEYEDILRGVKGVKYLLRDKYNKVIGSYKEGKFDTLSQQGKDLTLTIDYELQKYGTELMINKRGGIVAIEPKTGEILALVSAPTYDPALLVGRQRSKNYTALYHDSIANPLFDRGLLAQYPPGSPFKILTGLVGLQEEVITPETGFVCHHGFSYGAGRFMKCHDSGLSKLNNGIYNSCNTYFCSVYRNTIDKFKNSSKGVDVWSNHVKSFGLGNYMGTDLPIGKKGNIPTSKTYERLYPNGGWRGSTIISNGIGQGEILTTPLQLANMMAVVANKGYYFTPHIVKKIKDKPLDKKFTTKHVSTVDARHFEPVIEGLADVYNKGTAASLKVKDMQICGKTGTAENKIRVAGKTYQLKDHSIFVAFAPKENPTIAIAVFVENGYWGNRWAGPIATLMIEKYVNGEITRTDLETRMLNGSLEEEYKKIENIIYQRFTETVTIEDTKPSLTLKEEEVN